MNKKQKIIIFITIITIILLAIGVGFLLDYYSKKNDKENKKSDQAKESVISQTADQIGGEITEDGFNITYESGKDRIIITVTKEPFDEYKKKGEEYLINKGVKLCDINYLVLPARGITAPFSTDDTSTCGVK